MSTATVCTDCTSISNFPAIGFSLDFKNLKKNYDEIVAEFRKAETIGRPLEEALNSLLEVYKECSTENWDGYDAQPLSQETYLEAAKLLKMLPSYMNFPMPEIIATPDGEIALEWYRGSRRIFVVSVKGDQEITYAGLFARNKAHGIEHFGASLPTTIVSNLKRLYSTG